MKEALLLLALVCSASADTFRSCPEQITTALIGRECVVGPIAFTFTQIDLPVGGLLLGSNAGAEFFQSRVNFDFDVVDSTNAPDHAALAFTYRTIDTSFEVSGVYTSIELLARPCIPGVDYAVGYVLPGNQTVPNCPGDGNDSPPGTQAHAGIGSFYTNWAPAGGEVRSNWGIAVYNLEGKKIPHYPELRTNAVPEPDSVVLLGTGLVAGLIKLRKRVMSA